jgi:hypothetical protein
MTRPDTPDALSRTDQARAAELAHTVNKQHDLQRQADELLDRINGMLYYWSVDGTKVVDLAHAAGISRQAVYQRIEAYRRTLDHDLTPLVPETAPARP